MLPFLRGIVSRLTGRDLLEIINNDDYVRCCQVWDRFHSRFPNLMKLLRLLRDAKAYRLCRCIFGAWVKYIPDVDGKDLLFIYESFAMYSSKSVGYLNDIIGERGAKFRSVLLTKGYVILTRYRSIPDLYYALTIGQTLEDKNISDTLTLISLQSMMVIPRLTVRHVKWPQSIQREAEELLLYEGTLIDPIFSDHRGFWTMDRKYHLRKYQNSLWWTNYNHIFTTWDTWSLNE